MLLPALPASMAGTRKFPRGKSLIMEKTWSQTGRSGNRLSREGQEIYDSIHDD